MRSVTPERWSEIEAVLDEVLDLPPEERGRHLDRACAGDPALRAHVERLLAAEADAPAFLEGEAVDFAVPMLPDVPEQSRTVPAEEVIGPYRLLREIGCGGMSTVYLAQRTDGVFEREVAVKILHYGAPTEAARRRFQTERQILADLSHPYITRVFDGGVTDAGRPYLVMEHVEGIRIDAYSALQQLSVDERLGLLLQVCEAVQYAHQNLIVHRDLKPSNLLVTEGPDGLPQVRLLDFGIAKLITERPAAAQAFQTKTGHAVMTPAYASPEQLQSAPITTASDVYQLGVLMCVLLAGRLPYDLDTRSIYSIGRVICEVPPLPPSKAAQRTSDGPATGSTESSDLVGFGVSSDAASPSKWAEHLKGDLDAIALKALRKTPEERYASVEALMRDLRRYLEQRPVAARTGTATYRARKFVRRNRGRLAVAAFAILLSIGGVVALALQEAQAERERERAETYARFLTDLFTSPDPFSEEVATTELGIRAFLDRGARRLRTELSDDPVMQSDLLRTIGDVYRNLGYSAEASTLFEEVLDQQRTLHGNYSREVVETLQRLAWVSGDAAVAESLYAEALATARAIEQPPEVLTAQTLVHYGHFLYEQGRHLQAERLLEESRAALQSRVEEEAVAYAGALHFLGMTKRALGKLGQADSLLQEAYAVHLREHGPEHPSTAVVMTELAGLAQQRDDLERARSWNRQALSIFEERLGPDHPYTATMRNNYALLLTRQERYEEAEGVLRRVLAYCEGHYGSDHRETISVRQNLATNLLRQGKLQEAEPLFRQVYAQYRAALPAAHHLLAFPLFSLTDLHVQQEAYRDAEEPARRALAHVQVALPDDHPYRAIAESRLGEVLLRQGRLAESKPFLQRGYETLQAAEGYAAYTHKACRRLAELYDEQGRAATDLDCGTAN